MLYAVSGIIVSMRGEYPRPGSVVFEHGGKILDVGDRKKLLKDYRPDIELGGEDHIVMPGLVNAHTHVPMVLMRGMSGTVSGLSWLKKIWEIEKSLRPEDVYAGAMLGIAHMVKSGVTTFADHYFFEEEVAKATVEIGVRGVLSKTFMDLEEPPPGHDKIDASIKFAENYSRWNSLVQTMIGPHSLYACSTEALKQSVEAALSSELRLHIHISESRDELKKLANMFGKRPIALAEELGILKTKPLLAHMTYAERDEIITIAKSGSSVAYAPFTKMRGGQAISPIGEMIDEGVRIGLATDGPASVYSLDIFREMRMMLAAQNHRYSSPGKFSPFDVLKKATLGGAEALGIRGIGSLFPGMEADLVILRPDPLKFWPLLDPYQAIVYSASPEDVTHVFVSGKPVVMDRKLVNADELKIIRLAEESLKRIRDNI